MIAADHPFTKAGVLDAPPRFWQNHPSRGSALTPGTERRHNP